MTKDTVVPGSNWEFNAEVTACFDDMLSRSIPGYNDMRNLCTELGLRFTHLHGDIVDLGASRGAALRPFLNQGHFCYALEVSEDMCKAMEEEFPRVQNLEIRNVDLRDPIALSGINYIKVALSVLTLQFVPIEYRARIIQNISNHMVEGGAFIFVEKITNTDSVIQELFVNTYHEFKNRNGYSLQDIEAKRASLENVLVSVTEEMNMSYLYDAGFTHVECFFRNLNFAGWIAIK